MIGFDGLDRGLFEIDRRGEIGKALGEIHGAVTDREARHLADDGFGELRGTIALKSRLRLSRTRLRQDNRVRWHAALRLGLFRSHDGLLRSRSALFFATTVVFRAGRGPASWS